MPNNEVGLPIAEPEGLFFTLKDIIYSPTAPKMNEPFTVKGKIDLLKIPFFGPLWIIATVVYPETWWESVIPIIGAPEVRATDIALGGNFEITFAKGFIREGEFSLSVRVYPGPTIPLDSIVLPPVPAAATVETTFIVAGEAPPEEELFRDFRIASYSKNGGTPVTPPGVLELDIGDRCRVNLVYNHKGPAVTGKFHAAIWVWQPWDPHDEILFAEQSFSVPQTADWESFEKSIDIIITSAISPGSDYGLYCKIMGITGADVFTEFLANVITITGVPVGGEFRNFGITGWTPDPAVLSIGDSLTVTHHFEYKGPRYTGADIRTAIGNRHYTPLPIIEDWFDEIVYQIAHLEPFGPNEDWVGYDVDVTILITTAISPGVDYDLYSKLTDIPGPDLYDYKDDIIEIIGVPPAGSIISKFINKAPEGFRIPIPTEVKADNNTFEVGVRYKNYSGRTVPNCGCKVEVRDPDGNLRASPPVDWTGMSHNEELEKQYNICRVDKPGNWMVHIDFLMDSTVVVDSYDGLLFTAVEEAPPAGSITSRMINKYPEGNNIPLPTTVKADDNTFEIRVKARNTGTVDFFAGVEIKVYDPDGFRWRTYPIDWTGISPNEELTWGYYNVCSVDKAGSWRIEIRFLEKDTSVVLDEETLIMTAIGIQYKGTITKKELDYEDSWRSVPIYSIPTGTRTRVRITGRNDMGSNQRMGIWWQVKDPDGHVVNSRSDWETYWTGPGNEQVFVGGSFDLNKAGTYRIEVLLVMNPADQVVVSTYNGTLCTVVAPVYSGSIISKYINKAPEGSRISLPTTVKADNNTFEVGVTAKNTGTVVFTGGVEVKVYDPDGTLRASPTVDWTGIDPGETLRWEYNICRVDKAGSWTIEIRFLEKTTSKVLDDTQTTMTATIVQTPSPWGSGVYTNVRLLAQDSASAGSNVPVTIEIKNKYSSLIHVSAIGVYDSEERFIDWLDYWIPPGSTHSFTGSFTMPYKDVTIHAYSWYEDIYGYWHPDCESSKGLSRS